MTSEAPQKAVGVVTIKNSSGMHARPAAVFVETTQKCADCEVQVTYESESVNGKSIMGLLMLAAAPGGDLTIEVTGNDPHLLLETLCQLVDNNFDMD